REQLLPELLTVPRPALDVRTGDGAMGGDGPGFRKRLLELADAEEVIAVAVGDVDVGQALAEGPHPLDQLGVLLDRGAGAGQYRVLAAVDQGGAVRDPLQVPGTVRQVTGDSLPGRGAHGVRERAIGHRCPFRGVFPGARHAQAPSTPRVSRRTSARLVAASSRRTASSTRA